MRGFPPSHWHLNVCIIFISSIDNYNLCKFLPDLGAWVCFKSWCYVLYLYLSAHETTYDC
jgi:hypothetical protein